MSQNETTTVLVTDAKNLTLIDATRENSPWWLTLYLRVELKLKDTGSDTRFDSNLVNILVKNNLVNNLVVHSC